MLIGICDCLVIVTPTLKSKIKLNQAVKNEILKLKHEYDKLFNSKTILLDDIEALEYQKKDIQKDIEVLKEIANDVSKNYLKSEMKLAEEKFDRAMEQLGEDYQKNKADYEEMYLSDLKEFTAIFNNSINQKQIELKNVENLLEEYKSKVQAIISSFKKEEEAKDNIKYHSINLLADDIKEINKLREVGKTLRDQDLLNKIIWKGYYEKPTNLMLGRVIGDKTITGIYIITNQVNHMSYIGQSTNIASRWKQHIKRGIGAETPTRNKLYPAMMEYGIENFTFEIIEECPVNRLNELETYWIDFFETQSYGYNVTKGGA